MTHALSNLSPPLRCAHCRREFDFDAAIRGIEEIGGVHAHKACVIKVSHRMFFPVFAEWLGLGLAS